jgi:hypothetical protein
MSNGGHCHHDALGEEHEEQRDGEPKCGSCGYYRRSPGYGNGREYHDQHPTNRDRQSKGKGDRKGQRPQRYIGGHKGGKEGKAGGEEGKVEVAVAKNIAACGGGHWGGQPRRKLHCPVCEWTGGICANQWAYHNA